MKPAPFDYVAAESVEHAVGLLARSSEAKIIAGGQSLVPVLNMRLGRPELVVDIGRLDELYHLSVDESGSLVIGAGVTQAQALAHGPLRGGWPMLAAGLAHIGHPQIRNRGTVCGSIAHNDPAAELPAVAIALGASFRVRSERGERTISANDMFTGPFTTALDPGDLLLEACFPAQPVGSGWSFQEFATRPGDFATVGVAVRLSASDGVVADPRIVPFGAGGSAARAHGAEGALVGSSPAEALDLVRAELRAELDPPDDVHASAATRRDLADKLVTQAVTEAWERCP